MTKFYILCLLFLPLFSLAEPNQDFNDIRAFIEAQKVNQTSNLNQQVIILIDQSKIPSESIFNLYGPELMLVGPEQTYHDCQANICKAYERNFFRQLGEIRFERHSSYSSEIQIWRIAILAQVLRIWESDPKGQHLQLLKNEIKITNVIFQ